MEKEKLAEVVGGYASYLTLRRSEVTKMPVALAQATIIGRQGVEARFRYDMARKTDRNFEHYERRLGGDLSWRFGIEPAAWLLLYGRVGVGVQEFLYSREAQTSVPRPPETRTSVSPYLVFGTGFEANFDRFFVRLEGEFDAYVGNVYKADAVLPGIGSSLPTIIRFPPQRPYSVSGSLGAGIQF